MSCGKILGGNGDYRPICGGLWFGKIAKCDDCAEREIRLRILKKQEAVLDKELRGYE